MKIRTNILATAAAGALVFAVGAVPAGSDETEPTVASVTGSATGGWFTDSYEELSGDGEYSYTGAAGPAPEVVLPPGGGGPLTDALDELVAWYTDSEDDTWDWTVAEGIEVSTAGSTGADGSVTSSASVGEAWDEDMYWVQDLAVECSADLADGVRGSTTLAEGEAWNYLEGAMVDVPTNPEPNTVLFEGETVDSGDDWTETYTVRLVLNEQIVIGDTITVTGVHGYILWEYVEDGGYTETWLNDSAYGIATCGVHTVDPPTPPAPPAAAAAPAQAAPRFTG